MRLDLPLPLALPLPPQGPLGGNPGTWHPLALDPDGQADELGARYYERRESTGADESAAPCLLTVSPFLPLPRSLPVLLQEALASEPDFRLDWKWPMLTPRVGPWELVVQLCVGTSQETGITTGRVYVALDAGSGAYLIVCIDRDPEKLAARQKEVLAILGAARLHRDRAREFDPTLDDPDDLDAEGNPAIDAAGNPPASAKRATEVVPPQQPPPEIYLAETLFSYLAD